MGNLLFSSWVLKKNWSIKSVWSVPDIHKVCLCISKHANNGITRSRHLPLTRFEFFLMEFKTSICMLVNEALPLIVPLILVSQPPVLVCLYPKTLKPFVLPATCRLTTSYLLSPLSLRITVFLRPWIYQSADHNNVCCALL